MLRPFDDDSGPFEGFGASQATLGPAPSAGEMTLAADDASSRRLIRRNCPQAPGIYGMVDAQGHLIYVGKSKSLRNRLLSYLTGKALDSKARRIITHARRLLWETAPHEFTALIRELELIRRWSPRFNVRGRPGRRRRAYLGLGRGPAPHVYLTDEPSRRDRLLVGPLYPSRDLERMVRRANDWFQLRDCSDRVVMRFADERLLFPERYEARCLRHAMGLCLGPCVAACTMGQYVHRARSARDFLCGSNPAALERLQGAMRSAAETEQYERAAALRDAWQDLTALDALLQRLRTVRRTYSFVYPLPSYKRGEAWFLIHRGQVAAVVPAPRSRTAARRCLRTLDNVYAAGPTTVGQMLPDDPDSILIVSQWFAARPEELVRTLRPDAARALTLAHAPAAAPGSDRRARRRARCA